MADIDGSSTQDTLTGTWYADTISGRDGSDTIFGGMGDDVIYGHSVADTQPGSEIITATRVASGLSDPVFATSAPGDPDRLFIVEQHTGRIRILDLQTGQLKSDSFLDLSDVSLANGPQQGLLGLAFHPDYQNNGKFYVDVTNTAGDTEIREYHRSNDDHADATAPRLVMSIPQPFANDNGGWIGFGTDRLLYIATGDGGGSGDPFNNAQDINSLLGKILRIDVNGDSFPQDPSRNYAIPGINPFAGVTPGADEVWMYGLRNPWRVSIDAPTGRMWIGDVGQNAREEVDVVGTLDTALNFGWRYEEGFLRFTGTPPSGLTDPILDYPHTGGPYGGSAVIGGYVYRGPGGADGLYVFGDFGSGNIWSVGYADGKAQDFINRNGQISVSGGGEIDQISSFAVDGSQRLYVIGLDGDIFRLTPGATAGDGMDYLRGEEGADRIYGGFGFDDVNGNQGDDTLSGGPGDDWVVGGKDQDVVAGDAGDDIVYGNLGDDTCDGGFGADIVRGGQGNDVLTGGAGADFLSGDRGDDTMTGGAGADLFNSFGAAGVDRVTDFNPAEGDRVRLDPGSTFTVSQQGADTVIDIAGGARMILVGVQSAALTGDWIFVG